MLGARQSYYATVPQTVAPKLIKLNIEDGLHIGNIHCSILYLV